MRDSAPRDPLDALIDETARSMTEGAPPMALRGAVRARIEQPRPPVWRLPAWHTALAGTALVVLTLVAGRALWPPGGTDQAPRSVQSTGAEAPPATGAGEAPAAGGTERLPGPAANRRAGGIDRSDAAPMPPEEPIVVPPMVVAPLELPRPVELALIDVPLPVEPELMEVPMPLRAELLEIEPLVIE